MYKADTMEDSTEVMYKLGRIESSVEGVLIKLDEYIAEAREGHKDHDKRLQHLETGETRRTAWAAGFGSAAGLAVTLLLKLTGHG
jgi:hypothetical protein